MTTIPLNLAVACVIACVGTLLWAVWLRRQIAKRDALVREAQMQADSRRLQCEEREAQALAGAQREIADARRKIEEAQRQSAEQIKAAQQLCDDAATRIRAEGAALIEQQMDEVRREGERVRAHYEVEAAKLRAELEPLRRFVNLAESEAQAREVVARAMEEAEALRGEANTLLQRSRDAAEGERGEAAARARELRSRAEAELANATREAGRIVAEANLRAESIAGDAYTALREKEHLGEAVRAIRNVIEGYGDRYIVPTRSVLDGLAERFGHTEAGQALKNAREQSVRMVEAGEAATCDYAEKERRATAIRFVVSSFNGRVDTILSREKAENIGTLEQAIRDAFNLVNLDGAAFRNARILPAYLDARLAELRWAVVVRELRDKEREEQRRLQEQIREEEKARREYERAIKDAEKEEANLREALEKARHEVASASAEQRAKFEAEIAALNQRLTEAEARGQRALSMAQQTKAGNVYIISNIGSFGESVFKIGMTRRLKPEERIWELSDASVPFDFDIHAMIRSEDAPTLERRLHERFGDLRINLVNPRKEFFRVPLETVRDFVREQGLDATFTMAAEAHEYRESLAIAKMTPEERARYHLVDATDLSDQ